MDSHHRLRLYRPCIPGLGDQCVNVHSKITFIDDQFLRVGSANLNNRSMGLDTECDLALEAGGEQRIRSAISAFRSRLLAEHLGVPRRALTLIRGETAREKVIAIEGMDAETFRQRLSSAAE